jgi:hypothetical protein
LRAFKSRALSSSDFSSEIEESRGLRITVSMSCRWSDDS